MVGRVLGQYRVDERIGAGGMGVVYRAFDTRLQRPVAIKLLNDPDVSNEDAQHQLLAEARMASALSHPNICTVHEVGEIDGHVFLVMEYVEGRRIDTLIPEGGLANETAIRYGMAVAGALEHAHDRGVLHRDLKSANVVVSTDGSAKILDFGIAKRTAAASAEEPTRPATGRGAAPIAGTLAYLAPEVLAGQPASPRSDIWSLGILLYEMASGTLPFRGRSAFELTAAILREPVPPLPGAVPSALLGIILRCLSKEPAQRYARAGEVRAALEAIAAGPGSIAASYRTPTSRLRGWKVAAGAILAITFAVAAFWARSLWIRTPPGGPVAPNENRLTLLLSSERRIVDPVLSPDGRMLAYVGEDDAGRYDLFVSQISGGSRIQLTADEAIETWPRFSPDGQRIAFTRREGGISNVCLIATLGGAITRIVARGAEPSWAPDGARLAFVYRSEPDQTPVLATARSDGSDIRILYRAEHAHPFIKNASWSVDGREIAFVTSAGGASSTVWTIPEAGGTPRRLSDDPVGVFSAEPVFTPDGRSVILSSNRGGATNLWSVPLAGGAPLQLTTGPGPDESPSIGSDGALTFLNSRWRTALVVRDIDRGQSRTLLTHSPYVWAPAVSPDGTLIAFSRAETGGLWHIWVVPVDGGVARQVTSGDAGEIYPRFTPDGSALVYHTWGTPHRIWTIALAGGPPTAVTPERAPDEAWADVSPDGRWLAFVRVVKGVEYAYLAPFSGGAARQLTSKPATTPRWSPDGTRLLFSHDRSYNGGISLIDADGGHERQISATGGWPVWWPDGRSFAFLINGELGGQNVRMMDLAGKPLAERAWPRFVGTNHLLDVFRSGSAIVTSMAVHQSDEIWLLRR